jgi:hypothetical protein
MQPLLVGLGRYVGDRQDKINAIEAIEKDLVERDNEYQRKKAELTLKVSGFKKDLGEMQNALVTNARLSLFSKTTLTGGLSILGLNRLLPLLCPLIEKFWRLHPRSSFLASCIGFGSTGFGLIALLAHYGHSGHLKEYKEVYLDLKALMNLEPRFKKINEGNENSDEEKKD